MGKKKSKSKKQSDIKLEIKKTEINVFNSYINLFFFVPEKNRKHIAILVALISFIVIILQGADLLGVDTEILKPPEQPPEAKVTIIGVERAGFEFSNTVSYGSLPSPAIQFKLENLDPMTGNPLSSAYYTYERIVEVQNTCSEDLYFFNQSEILCGPERLVKITDTGEVINLCGLTYTETLKPGEETDVLKAIFWPERKNFLETLKERNISESCNLTEKIMICAQIEYNNFKKCNNVTVPIKYTHFG